MYNDITLALTYLGIKAKTAVTDFFTKEDGEVNVVAIVILIAVAISLALLFRDKISEMLGTMLDKISEKGEDAVDTTV